MSAAKATYRFEPYASHLQFHLQDLEGVGIDGDGWFGAPQNWRIAVGSEGLAIGTTRYDVVPVVVEILAESPAQLNDLALHIVEADLSLPSGGLAVTGCLEWPPETQPIALPPGRYRVRVSHLPAERPQDENDSEPGDYLEYWIAVWPSTTPADVAVLKQGDTVWAG